MLGSLSLGVGELGWGRLAGKEGDLGYRWKLECGGCDASGVCGWGWRVGLGGLGLVGLVAMVVDACK